MANIIINNKIKTKNMAKIKACEIDSRERSKIIYDFFEIVSNLKNKKEAVDFFLGLLTSSEALMMARRIQVAKEVIDGRSYDEIRAKLKVSFQTITKTDQWLNSGDEEYDAWIKRIIKGTDNNKQSRNDISRKGEKYFFNSLEKYAHHRLMSNLFQ